MNIDADRLAEQTRLAYDFMQTLHGQALALIKDVEAQLEQTSEELKSLRFGGYRYAMSRQSTSLRIPRANIPTYYAVCFRHYRGRIVNTPLRRDLPLIAFLKVVLHERNLEHPELRFGVITHASKAPDRSERQGPKKFEDIVTHLADRTLRPPWWEAEADRDRLYEDNYVSLTLRGTSVRLAELPNSEAIADQIVDPLMEMYRIAADQQIETNET
jgi:hypothetical protein